MDEDASAAKPRCDQVTCAQCDEAVARALQQARPSKLFAVVRDKLAQSGQQLDIICKECPESGVTGQARAYIAIPPPHVVICVNNLRSSSEIEEALVHELVHLYDYTVTKVDLTDCNELACSEIRAARDAECHYASLPFEWMRRRCIARTATRSTKAMFPDKGASCVSAMLQECMARTEPQHDAPHAT